MKFTFSSAAVMILAASTAIASPNGDNVDNDPGVDGRANAFNAPGFATAAEASGKDIPGLAADLFGDNGKGNGADPDAFGLEPDHDPGNFGGQPDTSR